MNDEPKIIQYLGLLKRWGDPDAPEVLRFLERHRDDMVFTRRAKTLRKVHVFDAFNPAGP